MDYQKGFIFLLQVFIVHLLGLTVGQPPLNHVRVNIGNYTTNSAYQANLNAVLTSLSSNVNRYGFYNSSVGQNSATVNAIVLCRGDVQIDTCRACINSSTNELTQRCPNYKEAIVWYDNCMLRYSNNSIIGKMTTDHSFSMPNSENAENVNQFIGELRTLLDNLRGQAAYAGSLSKFAAGDRTPPDFQKIYALVQCTTDLSADDCNDCLINAAADGIPKCCNGKKGGRFVGPSCNLRYESYPFFNEATSDAGQSPQGEGQPPLALFCVDSGNCTQNRAYQSNRNALLSSLSSNVNRYGFYNGSIGQNSDRVNAVVLCRGDVQLDTCRACINNSTRVLLERCPNQKEAIVWYDYCMLRYSNNSIIGTIDHTFHMPNAENFTSINQSIEELRTLLDSLRGEAAYAGPLRKFVAGNTSGPGFQTIYALEQCIPDMSAKDCSRCLIKAAEYLPTCCNGKKGGRVVGPSCNLRYETYSFFSETPSEAGQSPAGEGENDSRTLIITILVISIFGGLMLIACICFILRKRKRKLIDELDSLEELVRWNTCKPDRSHIKDQFRVNE